MTVSELMTRLQHMDPEMQVLVVTQSVGYVQVSSLIVAEDPSDLEEAGWDHYTEIRAVDVP